MPVLPRPVPSARSPLPPSKPSSPILRKAPLARWRQATAVRVALLLPFFVVAFAGYRFFASGGESAQVFLGESVAVAGQVAQVVAEDAPRQARTGGFAEGEVIERGEDVVVDNGVVGGRGRSKDEAGGGEEKGEIAVVGGGEGENGTVAETASVGEGGADRGDSAAGEDAAVGDSVDGNAAAVGESASARETTAAGEVSTAGGDTADGEASAAGDAATSGETTAAGEGSAAGGDSAAGEAAAAGESTSPGEVGEQSLVGREKSEDPAVVAVEKDQSEVVAGEGRKTDGDASIAGAGEGEAPVAGGIVDRDGESDGKGKGVATLENGEVEKDAVAGEGEKKSSEVVTVGGGEGEGEDAVNAKGENDAQEREKATDADEVVAKGESDGENGKDTEKAGGDGGEKKENSDIPAENEREAESSENEDLRRKKEEADVERKNYQARVDEEPKIGLNEAGDAKITKEAEAREEAAKKANDTSEVASKTPESVEGQAVEEKRSEAPPPGTDSETRVSEVVESAKVADKPLSEQSPVESDSKVENQDAKAAEGGDLAESKSEGESVAGKVDGTVVIEGKGLNVPETTKDEKVTEAVEGGPVESDSKVENQDEKAAEGGDLAESKSEGESVAGKVDGTVVIEGKGLNVPETTKDEKVTEAVEGGPVESDSKVENQDEKAAEGGDLAESKSEGENVAGKVDGTVVIEGKGLNVPETTKDEKVTEAVEGKLVPSNEVKTAGEIALSQNSPAESLSQDTLEV